MPVLKVKNNGVWQEVSAAGGAGGSSINVDTSLTMSGAAADAKAAGDAVSAAAAETLTNAYAYTGTQISNLNAELSGEISELRDTVTTHIDLIEERLEEFENSSGDEVFAVDPNNDGNIVFTSYDSADVNIAEEASF